MFTRVIIAFIVYTYVCFACVGADILKAMGNQFTFSVFFRNLQVSLSQLLPETNLSQEGSVPNCLKKAALIGKGKE